MKRVAFGRTDLTVTRLGLGLAPIGGLYEAVTDEQASATIDRAWQRGLRLFDTAPLYGYGLSERRAGAALRDRPRAEFVLATKVGRLLVPGGVEMQPMWVDPPEEVGPQFDFSYAGAMRSFESSLERLGLDRIDILHIHDPDEHYDEALAGAYRALRDLRDQGVIGAVSAGMNQAAMPARFAREADFDAFLLAGRYTLLDQSGLAELLPLCAERGIAVIAAGVYGSGLLADPRPGAYYNYAPASPALVRRALDLQAICQRYGVPLRAAAIQFPFGHPAIASVVVGANTPAQVDDAVDAFDTEIPPDLWAELKAAGLLPEGVPTPP
jgi:D-threo-aldose 1-dehydrogenase